MPKRAHDSCPKSSTVPLLTSTARGDDKPTQSNNNSGVEQHPDWPTEHTELTKRKSTTANDAVSIKLAQDVYCPPTFFGVLDNDSGDERSLPPSVSGTPSRATSTRTTKRYSLLCQMKDSKTTITSITLPPSTRTPLCPHGTLWLWPWTCLW